MKKWEKLQITIFQENFIMKKVRLILGIGVLAAGAIALYYLTKEKESVKDQPVVSKADPPAKEPAVSEEDKAILKETFGETEKPEVTEERTPELAEEEAAAEKKPESTVAADEEAEVAASAFKPAPGSRRIGQYDDEMNLIAEYVSATVAAKAVGSNRTSIRNCANGKQKHAGGYIWRYLDQQNDQAE